MTNGRKPRVRDGPRLLDRVRIAVRVRHLSRRTETAYVGWIRRFLVVHGMRHPEELDAGDIDRFLRYLGNERGVSAATQNQARAALLFFYRNVLEHDPGALAEVVHAARRRRVPVVLSRAEVRAVMAQLEGTPRLVTLLLYGSGLRLLEALRLRIKDVDLGSRQLTIHDGKSKRDRRTVLAASALEPLRGHLETVRLLHERSVERGLGFAPFPGRLARKYPSAAREWKWQWLFPATRTYVDRSTGTRHRHHLHESVIQRAMRRAVVGAGIPKKASCHTLRHNAESRIMPS